MCRSAVLTEIPSARATCLVCSPRASIATTSASRSVSPAGRSRRGARWPAASSTTATASGSSRPARTSSARTCAACSRQRLTMRPQLGHRVVGVGRASKRAGKRRALLRWPHGGSRIRRCARDGRPRSETAPRETASARARARCGRDAGGPAPIRRRSGVRASARSAWTATRPRSWRSPARRIAVAPTASMPQRRAAAPASSATPTEWPVRYGRDQVGEARHRDKPAIERFRLRLQHERGMRLQREDLVPGRGALVERQDLGSIPTRQAAIRGSKAPGVFLQSRRRVLGAASETLEGASVDVRSASAVGSAALARCSGFAVPALISGRGGPAPKRERRRDPPAFPRPRTPR